MLKSAKVLDIYNGISIFGRFSSISLIPFCLLWENCKTRRTMGRFLCLLLIILQALFMRDDWGWVTGSWFVLWIPDRAAQVSARNPSITLTRLDPARIDTLTKFMFYQKKKKRKKKQNKQTSNNVGHIYHSRRFVLDQTWWDKEIVAKHNEYKSWVNKKRIANPIPT